MKRMFLTFLCITSSQTYSHADHQLASPFFQKLGMEAQEAMGIEHPQPLYLLDQNHPKTAMIAAKTTKDGIFINPDVLSSLSYGELQAYLRHEAFHAKNNDPEHLAKAITTSRFVSGGMAYALLGRLAQHYRFSWSLGIAALAGAITHRLALLFIESRADREGLYATQCATCAQEVLNSTQEKKTNQTFHSLDIGYLKSEEITLIVKDLKGQSCNYHASTNNYPVF